MGSLWTTLLEFISVHWGGEDRWGYRTVYKRIDNTPSIGLGVGANTPNSQPGRIKPSQRGEGKKFGVAKKKLRKKND